MLLQGEVKWNSRVRDMIIICDMSAEVTNILEEAKYEMRERESKYEEIC